MANIYFGDVSARFVGPGHPNPDWKKDLENDLSRFEKFTIDLNLLYSNWSNAFGENFQPIIIIDDKITFNQSLLLEWENNEKLQTFCFQGGKWNEQWIKWGDKIVLKEDKDIHLFTKELLSLMGDQSQVRFDLNVTTSNEEEEEYTVIIKFEKEKKDIIISYDSFFDDED